METAKPRWEAFVPSLAITSKKNCPLADGVPENVPSADRARPGGRGARGPTDQLSGPEAPVAPKDTPYAEPTKPLASVKLPVIEMGVTVIVNWRCANVPGSVPSSTRSTNV